MKPKYDVIVVGGGVGSLCAATLLGATGLDVLLLESSAALGGKAAQIERDGVWMDTGPSVLTLPGVFEDVFRAVDLDFKREVKLHRPQPGFRYIYSDGPTLDVFHDIQDTLASVHSTLGASAAAELERYLGHTGRIWRAAEPHFVSKPAPSLATLLGGGWAALRTVTQLDALRTMARAIDAMVKDPYLRTLLRRYATYNGSDVRRAPGTLGCIAHVELSLGGFGVVGGMYQLVLALARALDKARVTVKLETSVTRLNVKNNVVTGVEIADGRSLQATQIIFGGDALQLDRLLAKPPGRPKPPRSQKQPQLSMSAHTSLFKASNTYPPRVAHTVVFPPHYEREFEDIFDHQRVPMQPTIYACDQKTCHLRPAWTDHSPLFAMINAPAVQGSYAGQADPGLEANVQSVLVQHGLLREADARLWWRTPNELAERFVDSKGALYGMSSNGMMAAFHRPSNASTIRGLFLASGSAHPGGGLPMVAQSGKIAASAALRARGRSPGKVQP